MTETISQMCETCMSYYLVLCALIDAYGEEAEVVQRARRLFDAHKEGCELWSGGKHDHPTN